MAHAAGLSPGGEAVIRAFDNCYDPCRRDRRISVVDVGLIESIEITGRQVRIGMILTTGETLPRLPGMDPTETRETKRPFLRENPRRPGVAPGRGRTPR